MPAEGDLRIARARHIPVDPAKIAEFCQRWHITELSLFGSVLRDDFRPDSDVDVLVEFEPGHTPGWKFFDAQEELEAMFRRPVDLVSKPALRNPFRRYEILRTRQVVYDARAA
jgi:predicted nucleotidyltransferase